jgi:hypothetical protein
LASCTCCVTVFPTVTFPNPTLATLAESFTVDVAPAPARSIVSGEPPALLVIETLPESAPAAVGLNATVKVTFEPAATVAGATRPEMLKPDPAVFTCEIERGAVPVFDNFIVWLASVFTATLPKFTEEGVTPISGAGVELLVGEMPVPTIVILTGVSLASFAIETLPEALPVAVGLYAIVKDTLAPTATVEGVASPETVKFDPVSVA